MTLQVLVWIDDVQTDFKVEAQTLPEAFAIIPAEAARRGFGLTTGGRPVDYQVSIIA